MSALTDLFTNIANAIRAKTGSQATIVASDFPTAISNIPSGGVFKPTRIQFPTDTTGSQLQDMLDDPALDFTELLSCNAMFGNLQDGQKIQLDLSRHTFPKATSANSMFYNARRYTSIVFNPNAFKSGALTSMQSTFSSMTSLTSIDLSFIDFSNVTSISMLFKDSTYLVNVNFGNADFSSLTNFSSIFSNVAKGTQKMVDDFLALLVNPGTNMSGVFDRYGISNAELTNLDITGLDTSNSTIAYQMFYMLAMSKQMQLTIGELDFGKTTSMLEILKRCNNLTKINGKFKDLGKAYTQATIHYSQYKLDLSETAIDHDSLVNIIDGLYDLNLSYNVAGGGTLYRQELKLGSTLSAKLSAAEIQVATDKGWDVT